MTDREKSDPQNAQRTALHAFHAAQGARFVPFAGYEMPVQYAPGVLKEHLHTRAEAGLFDVSHMGQVRFSAKDGSIETAALALERLVPVDVLSLAPGRQRYALFTNEAGGILDDLMIAHRGDHYLLVVNAACKAADVAHLDAHCGETCDIALHEDRALLALQGPKAEAVLHALAPEAAAMRFMDVREIALLGVDCIVSRSGYSGEDGYEISAPSGRVEQLAEALLKDPAVALIGLGARDSLRLEAGLCLYGADLDPQTTPIEASLEWAIQRSRRAGGAREGGFPGADRILEQFASGVEQRRVGLAPEGRAPVRVGAPLFESEDATTPIGRVTSGGFGPSVGAPVAMGYVAQRCSAQGARLFTEVRGKRLPANVAATPFTPHRYKRS